jgi:hypothetical protein
VQLSLQTKTKKAIHEGKAKTMSELIRKAVLIFLEAQNG